MAQTLEATINSVLNQTCTEWELVIVDNASSDGSNYLASKYAQKDHRINVITNPSTVSMADNYNNCIKQSHGDLLTILSADDLLHPEFISSCVAMHTRFANLGYVATGHDLIDENGIIRHKCNFYKQSAIIPGPQEALVNLAGNHSAPSYMMYRKKALISVGGFPPEFPFCFDIMTKLRINLINDIGYISEKLCHYRVTTTQGPSLYRRNDFSPIFDLYRIKSQILHQIKLDANSHKELVARVNDNLSRVCMGIANFLLKKQHNYKLAKQYAYLAIIFCPQISYAPAYRHLSQLLVPIHDHTKPNVEYCQSPEHRTPPYELPPGSSIIKSLHLKDT